MSNSPHSLHNKQGHPANQQTEVSNSTNKTSSRPPSGRKSAEPGSSKQSSPSKSNKPPTFKTVGQTADISTGAMRQMKTRKGSSNKSRACTLM